MNFLSPLNILWITLAVLFGGEPAVISLAFAAVALKTSLAVIIVAGYFTAVLGDIFWFSLAKRLSPDRIKKWKFVGKTYDAYIKTASKIDPKKIRKA